MPNLCVGWHKRREGAGKTVVIRDCTGPEGIYRAARPCPVFWTNHLGQAAPLGKSRIFGRLSRILGKSRLFGRLSRISSTGLPVPVPFLGKITGTRLPCKTGFFTGQPSHDQFSKPGPVLSNSGIYL